MPGLSRVTPFTVGGFQCHALEGGIQRLDGGAMFGVVPKPLWNARIPADERNRIRLAMRCILIEHPDAGVVLLDTALGNKEDARFRDIYGVENLGEPGTGDTWLEEALAETGHRPSDVRWVINTHLHFDHAGGNTRYDVPPPEGLGVPNSPPVARLTFPEATYVVQRRELQFARNTNERTRASYLPPNFEPVAAADRWRLLEGDEDILPGIASRLTPGHVPFHQSIVIHNRGEVAVFLGDVIPTAHHLSLPWVMGYDLEPMRTLESKRDLLADAVSGGWRLIFEHDADTVLGRAVPGPKGVVLEGVVAAPGVDIAPESR